MSFTIYRPVQRDHINQPFGVNWVNFYAQLGLKGHNGLDWEAHKGDPIHFNFSGKGEVIALSNSWTQGIGVTILVKDGKNYYKLLYWHMQNYCVKEGQIVETGDLLGYADNSGISTGDHLHFGMYYSTVNGATMNKDNGYGGALNPMPWYQDHFVCDVMNDLNKKVSLIQRLVNLWKQLKAITK